jgi:hypothetical protein
MAMEAEPRLYRAIMVSSTFTDLEAHRREGIEAPTASASNPVATEYSSAADVRLST